MPDAFDDLLGSGRGHPDADVARADPGDTPLHAARRMTAALNTTAFGLDLPLGHNIRAFAEQHGLHVVEYLALARQSPEDGWHDTGFLAVLAAADTSSPFAAVRLYLLPRVGGGEYAELLTLDQLR